MNAPYISQLVAGSGGNRCGPATVAMALSTYGKVPATQDEMLAICREEHAIDGRPVNAYTDFNDAVQVAERHGVATDFLGSMDLIDDALAGGNLVMLLTLNSLFVPRPYPPNDGWTAHHFVLLTDKPDPDHYLVNDPLRYPVLQPILLTAESVVAAAEALGVQALAFHNPNPQPTQEVPAVDDTERQALQGQIDALNGVNTELQNQVNALHAEVSHLREDIIPTLEAGNGDPAVVEALKVRLAAILAIAGGTVTGPN